LTIGEGSVDITGAGISTPALSVAGQDVTGGGGGGSGVVEFLGTFQDSGGAGVTVDIPLGYIRYDLHIVNAQHVGVGQPAVTFEARITTVATPTDANMDTDCVTGSAQVGVSSMTYTTHTETANRFFLHRNTADNSMGNDAEEKWNGILTILNPGSSTNYSHYTWQGSHISEGTDLTHVEGSAVRKEKSPVIGVKLRGNTGDTFEITVHLYGYPEPA
jgi:hypothetical protein